MCLLCCESHHQSFILPISGTSGVQSTIIIFIFADVREFTIMGGYRIRKLEALQSIAQKVFFVWGKAAMHGTKIGAPWNYICTECDEFYDKSSCDCDRTVESYHTFELLAQKGSTTPICGPSYPIITQ